MMEQLLGNMKILTIIIPIITFGGTIIVLLNKVLNRSKIEILLEDKFTSKLYNLIEFTLGSIFIASSISFFAYSYISFYVLELPDLVGRILILITQIFVIYFMVSIAVLPFVISFINSLIIKKKSSPFGFIKVISWNNITLLIVLVYFNLIVSFLANQEQIMVVIFVFSILYLLLILFANYTRTLSKIYNSEFYQISILKDEVNKVIAELYYIYALGNEKLIFIEKKDSNHNNVNELSVFYVYHTNNNLLMKYEINKE